jgi:hypothetical protein
MRDIFTLFLHAIVTIIRLGKPGGWRIPELGPISGGFRGSDVSITRK